MKCQQCDKPATFHITELTGGKPQELHLCEDHARQYLTVLGQRAGHVGSMAAALAQQMAQQMAIGQTAEELAQLDQQACPVCGITFFEFRSQGRLGCPHDYIGFKAQLEPLILNIHGEVEHVGKRPAAVAGGSEQRTQLIRLRREMKEAIDDEKYERASELRDEIRRIETEARPLSGIATPWNSNDLTADERRVAAGHRPRVRHRHLPAASAWRGTWPIFPSSAGPRPRTARRSKRIMRDCVLRINTSGDLLYVAWTSWKASIGSCSSSGTSSAASTPRARAPAPWPSTAARSSA